MVKKILFQLHWLLGITAGLVLAVTGATGGLFAFEAELLRWLNPGVVTVTPPSGQAKLGADALLARLAQTRPGQRVTALNLSADAADAARVTFAVPGERRGRSEYLDPYSGAVLGTPRGEGLFRFVEDVHRRLAFGDTGKAITGAATLGLVFLCLSGLTLRWPRRAFSWRAWLTFDVHLKGRSFLWGLHSMAGTWVLLCFLLAALTGLFWSYTWYRDGIYALTGAPRPEGPPRAGAPGGEGRRQAPPMDLGPAWRAFTAAAPDWRSVNLRLPERAGQPLQFNYLDAAAPHERARSRLQIDADGTVRRHERHGDLAPGAQLVAALYPLHTGSYFSLPGRLVMMAASLAMPLFAVTGWLLYLDRRRKQRAVRLERRQAARGGSGDEAPWLVGYASQSGTAERLAWQSAGVLQAAGLPVTVAALDRLDGARLGTFRHALFVVSTFGDGEPPDNARAFARRVMADGAPLQALRFGLLALGDRHYANFCGFGRRLEQWLRGHGGQPLFAPVHLDGEDGLLRWRQHLAEITGGDAAGVGEAAPWQGWPLTRRTQLNAGSAGGPVWLVEFEPLPGARWQAGDVAEILAGCTPATADWAAPVRQYSICTLPEEGRLALLVRQVRHDGGLGAGSGWLTDGAPVGCEIALRLRSHPGFHLPEGDFPLILIGNGTGMAGLRPLIRARALAGRHDNWLLFGERHAACDFHFGAEIAAWRDSGVLRHVDLAFSRDQAQRIHVQDRLAEQAARLTEWVAAGAMIYVCGSAEGMAPGVHGVLVRVLGEDAVAALAAAGRYRRDVY